MTEGWDEVTGTHRPTVAPQWLLWAAIGAVSGALAVANAFQSRWVWVGINALLLASSIVNLARLRTAGTTIVSPDGLRVRRGFGWRSYTWDEVVSIDRPRTILGYDTSLLVRTRAGDTVALAVHRDCGTLSSSTASSTALGATVGDISKKGQDDEGTSLADSTGCCRIPRRASHSATRAGRPSNRWRTGPARRDGPGFRVRASIAANARKRQTPGVAAHHGLGTPAAHIQWPTPTAAASRVATSDPGAAGSLWLSVSFSAERAVSWIAQQDS